MGIVGPTSAYSSVHVQSICDTKEIPLIEMKLGASDKSAINLHPSPEDLGRVYVDLIEAWGWKSFTILYEDAPWLPSIEYLIRNCSSRMAVAVRQLDLTLNFNYRQRLQQVKKSEEKNIILSCSIERLEDILMQAQQVGLLTDEHTILITSLDMHTLDLTPFQYSGTNITGLRMVFPEDDFVKKTADFFEDKYFELPRDGEEDPNDHDINDDTEIPLGLTPDRLRVETALAFDSGRSVTLKPYKCFESTIIF
jgi:ionotropic glutamate receptor